jgi:transketolase
MTTTPFIMGMRDAFFEALFTIAKGDPEVVFVSADNGAPTLDRFVAELPDRFFTVGIAEAQMIGLAAGLALEGKKVYAYAIAPFITTRVHEQVKIDVCSMNLPIVLLGVGAGYAYDIMGPTHHTVEDIAIMRALPNLVIHSPADGATAAALARISRETAAPQYIRFDRAGIPEIHAGRKTDFVAGLAPIRAGRDVLIIATGVMTHTALEVAATLADRGIEAGVVDLFRLKPVNVEVLLELIAPCERVVTLEEHLLAGGIGSIVAEILADHGVMKPLLRIGQDDRFVFDLGGREAIWRRYGLDEENVTRRIREFIGQR